MILEDLEYIFKPQVDEGTNNLYLLVFDTPEHAEIVRHPADQLESLLLFLDSLQYAGNYRQMPRFKKSFIQ